MVSYSMYRPFVKVWVYFSKVFNTFISLLPKIFPEPGIEQTVIVLRDPGNSKDFSALVIKQIPDRHFIGNAQVFPFYTYEPYESASRSTSLLDDHTDDEVIVTAPSGKHYIRRENITDWALGEYRKRYGEGVTKEDIFYYVYGLLHSLDYRERYQNDLKKSLPRIPFVSSEKDFWAFSRAGRKLAELHLNYETVEPWPLEEQVKGNPRDPATYRVTKMRFGRTQDGKEDKMVIIYNDYVTLHDIPSKAYEHVVNGKSAIDWIVERYRVRQDKKSGIVNDPNKWLEEQGDPRYIVDLIKRVVRVSVDTVRIVEELPELDIEVPVAAGK